MPRILVAGLINVETTVKIKEFPVAYTPVSYTFNGIETTVSGVGVNVAKALCALGAKPRLLSVIGRDLYQEAVFRELERCAIDTSHVLPILEQTPQSVILYDESGKREINLDLKNIQAIRCPFEGNDEIWEGVELAAVCNINFARNLLLEAQKRHIPVATDVHVVNDIQDGYNRDFMRLSDILFLSNEGILGREEDFIWALARQYGNQMIVVGMGGEGVLLYTRERHTVLRIPAFHTRKVINTIGAGDALFSAFLYFYCKHRDPYDAIEKAMLFASYKIGERGAANGFLTEQKLLRLQADR